MWRLRTGRVSAARHVRKWLRRHGIRAVIPHVWISSARTNAGPCDSTGKSTGAGTSSSSLVGWLKERRRLANRFEKLALHFGAMAKLTVLQLYMNRLLVNCSLG